MTVLCFSLQILHFVQDDSARFRLQILHFVQDDSACFRLQILHFVQDDSVVLPGLLGVAIAVILSVSEESFI